jgi:hypothetical protein
MMLSETLNPYTALALDMSLDPALFCTLSLKQNKFCSKASFAFF